MKALFKGDIYWVPIPNQATLGKGITHPHVILQETELNQSRISTVVVCALSTNMKRAFEPGNVLLDDGEGKLAKRSVVVVSQVSVVEKKDLGNFVGRLDPGRMDSIFAGMRLQQSLALRGASWKLLDESVD